METMRKTRRLRKGRCIAVLAPLLLAVLLLVGGFLQARAADEGRSMQAVVVGQGDTLWQLVQKHYDYKGDIRRAIYEVRQINGMQDALIVPGQVVYIPRH